MKAKVKQLLCMLLLNSILLTAVFSAPAAFADDGLSSESIEYTEASAEEPSVSARLVTNKSGTWIKAADGRYWYKHTDGTYTKNDWEYIDGSWYFFDANGWMLSAQWKQWEGKWYYLNPSGVMHTGWLKNNGKWYYFTMRGIMQTGWITLDGNKYYLDANGVMQIGWRKMNGNWYYFKPDGVMNTETILQNGREYRFTTAGILFATRIFGIRQTQQQSNWCWAACSVMVGTYNVKSSTVTQKEVVEKLPSIYKPGHILAISWATKYASNNTKNPSVKSNLTFEEVVNKIDENKPIILDMRTQGKNGHAMVCTGYNTLQAQIHITDSSVANKTDYYIFKQVISTGIKLGESYYDCSTMIIY